MPKYSVAEWEDDYRRTLSPITVDFRHLGGAHVSTERYTHLIHTYPAKLLPQIPYVFLNSSLIYPRDNNVVVADPFCGSGTVLLEAALCGYDSIGADVNPLARLIAKVKTRPICPNKLNAALVKINRAITYIKKADIPAVVNISYWYNEQTIYELSKLRKAIAQIEPIAIREFMQVCFSVCARKVSLADPRMNVPVKINADRKHKYGPHYAQLEKHIRDLSNISVRDRFNRIVARNIERITTLHQHFKRNPKVALFRNAIGLERHKSIAEANIIITSPPYGGAQKYIRTSSLSLGWLDMAYEGELRALERTVIGREHYSSSEVGQRYSTGISQADEILEQVADHNRLRAHIAFSYLHEMEAALKSMYETLTRGGNLILVVAPNVVCGRHFDTPEFLEAIAQRVGFATRFKLVDHIKSRGLMTKRNKTANIIASEVVLCMRKPL